ncbi:MAG: phosphoglycolate phosphatase [Usitatibacter sp.]
MTSSPAPIRAVILDLDGTLVDSAGEIGVALNETLAELGVRPMSLEAVKALIGRGVRSLVERALELQGAVADIDRAVKRFEAHYGRTVATHATLFPGVKDGLAALRDEGIELAVVTNKPRAFTDRLLRHLHIDGFFAAVVSGDDGIARKPAGDMLVHAARSMGAEPGEALMIGDSDTDVLAARAAGCLVWCVPYGYNEGRPAASLECDRMVDSVLHAAQLLAAR